MLINGIDGLRLSAGDPVPEFLRCAVYSVDSANSQVMP
jgi:hypothetical protein